MERPCFVNMFVFRSRNPLILEVQILVSYLGMSYMLCVFSWHTDKFQCFAFVFTRRSRALERSRQILPPRDGALRGWGSTSQPLPLLPSGPVVSGAGDQTCGATASQQRQGGGERSPSSCLCRNDETTEESTRPRHPARASHDPAERGREDAPSRDKSRQGKTKWKRQKQAKELPHKDQTAGLWSEGDGCFRSLDLMTPCHGLLDQV